MAGPGRPRKGKNCRSAKIVICLEPGLKEQLEELADEARRSISDYCRYVLAQHFWAVKQQEGWVEGTQNESGQSEFEQ